MLTKNQQKKAVKSIVESGELEQYSQDYFRRKGREGRLKYLKNTPKEKLSESAKRGWEKRRKSYPQE